MWRVTSPESEATIYLFGSIHVATEEIYPLPTAIMDAFHGSDYLALEIDMSRENVHVGQQVRRMLMYEEGMTIADEIGSDLHERVKQALRDEGMGDLLEHGAFTPDRSLDDHRPSIWMSLLSAPAQERLGLTNWYGLEAHFEREKRRRMHILEIECIFELTQMNVGFSQPLQILLLEDALDIERNIQAIRAIYEAWMQGDADVLADLGLDHMPSEFHAEFVDAMYIQRGLQMLEAVEESMSLGRNVFFVVGISHMVREGGLVDSLIERGYDVERVVWW